MVICFYCKRKMEVLDHEPPDCTRTPFDFGIVSITSNTPIQSWRIMRLEGVVEHVVYDCQWGRWVVAVDDVTKHITWD